MSEEKLIDHVVSRLEPQILDYVEVRHPQKTANLLQIVDKYEESFMNRQIRGSSEGFRCSNPNENNRFNNRHRQENWRENRILYANSAIRTLTDALVLQLPNFSEQLNLFTDASGVGIGAVLQQNQKPIAFASRTLNKAERNYTVTEREFLAVIWALNKFKTYFGPLPVKVITDHAALTKLTNDKNLSCRMIRWALKLSEFNIEWEHRPGVQNVVTDLLSRNPVDSIEGSQISCAALKVIAINSREQFIREQREDPELGHITDI
ncbi:retrovirus-related Pol polyprotein from transposon opus [Trichonephila clavipes]|nr:retrovirus-related Pol polyprotein from transposon opus [Trichonephila clavipes]